jgi:sugar phosphate isomerase/epimerase
MNRRHLLHAGAASLATLCALADEGLCGPNPRQRLGVVVYSYGIRRGAEPKGPLQDPLGFVEHCRKIGAGGVQIGLGNRDADYAARLRQRVEAAGMYLEGMVRLPTDQREVEGFEREIATARACGATVVRAALLSGRRYEVFKTAQEFRDFRERSRRALALARPVVERHKLRLAIENHKDWRSAELVELLREVKSPNVGACVDTGNSIALLETPDETVDALAPFAFSTHLKDMGVEECNDGFLLSEVPLGSGLLDLPRVLRTLRQANPAIRFNLEMITRDPLRIPCLSRGYWATLEDLPARPLATMLTLVRANAARGGLPRPSTLELARRIEREEENVRSSMRVAREKLDL